MLRILALLFAVFLVPSRPLHAQGTTRTANGLVNDCTVVDRVNKDSNADAAFQAGRCLGFLSGFMDATQAAGLFGPKIYCQPSDSTIEQLRKVFLKHMADHPELLHLPEGVMVAAALQKAFPCKQ